MTTTYPGLSSASAAQRLRVDGANELPSDGPRSNVAIVIGVLAEPMFLLLLAAAGVYLILGDAREALVLSSSIAIIIAITVLQERRTENTLAKLRDLTSPRALVIRDGISIRIAGRDVVVGDIVLLREGDRVPADGIVLEGTALSVDESILTGESLPVNKSPHSVTAQQAATQVFSGSLIVSGYGVAEITATGSHTQIGKIGRALQSVKSEVTPLYREVRKLVRWVASAGLLLCVLVAVIFALTRGQWLAGVLAGITVAMGILPEEFPVVLTVFLAMGAWRISRHNVLTRRMPAIESLGAVTVLAVDKTGTLTENRMRVALIATPVQQFDLRDSSTVLDDAAGELLATAMAASERDAFDPMEHAIHETAAALVPQRIQRYQTMQLMREYDLTPQLLAVTHVWRVDESNSCDVVTKGAPEAVMKLCRLDDAQCQALLAQVATLSQQGLRVLAVARTACSVEHLPDTPAAFDLHLMGLLCLADPIRATVPAALKQCTQAGIRVVMITGDYAGTALAIAQQAGFDNSAKVLTCSDMDAMSDDELCQRIPHINIFARATPQHKLRLVQALKANGEVVVMTGDGVNDAPALKAAHVGVAMGLRGTDVAREAAALVLLDDDFASLVSGVRLGRRIYDNIQHAMCYLVAVHIPLAGMGLLPVLLGWPLLLFPVQVLFLEFVIDPACSFVFEADSEAEDVMRRKPRRPDALLFSRNSMRRSIVIGCSSLVITAGVYGIALAMLSEPQARSLCFMALVLGNVVMMLLSRTQHESLLKIIARRNVAFWGIVGITLIALGIVTFVTPVENLFHFSAPPLTGVLLVIGCALLALLAAEAILQRKRKTITTNN